MSHIFWSNLFRQGEDEITVIGRLWRDTPLFSDIPRRHIEHLATKMHLRQFKKDEVIFRQGDGGAGAILVFEGSVRIMADKTELSRLDRGDFFGEIALAENDQRTADAYALENSRLVYFLKQDLEEWIETEPRLGARFLMNLSSTLAQRLHQANQIIATI
ncbi:MAG: CRP/FNR family cyclic AMP-dependent transcriptional regulator [Gammaproteobacteria bacterium]|jgi:CRP/FNR family cyclic AMP-dependent transcriptional regulator